VPASAGTTAPPPEKPLPRFRRPDDELVARAARRLVRGNKASFPSQEAFREAVVRALRHDDPLAALGGRRLRRLLVDVPGVRLSVRYAERDGRPLPSRCPVCSGALAPIRNRTLTGETVELGKRCVRCDYWTHGVARVPVRYSVSQVSGRRAPAVRD
jgi:ribosomal protein L34E